MNLTIELRETDLRALQTKAAAQGVSAEQYIVQVLQKDLAPEWLRESWESARQEGLDQLTMDEIDAEIAAARQGRRRASE
ncbi:MAG: hypothetical protein U0R19_16700 [Bryobacteraceae bacterium]|mgnify:CR=1 FL=1